ncbi:AmmeMemoRadiSam system protein A [Endozoicomonas sp.]|nr:AmmeMemoRadiSam system protein A [Endozoicomonas sp.]
MSIPLSISQQRELLRLARQVIVKGCTISEPPALNTENYPDIFNKTLATFVTLQKHGNLRGCIGSLQATRPLIEDIIHNAFASAFRDSRFQPVTEHELAELQVEISILSPMALMPVSSEEELLKAMIPGKDGIYLQSPNYSATFLPQVWEQLPEPLDFLNQLKKKAGLHNTPCPNDMRYFRYSCMKIKEQEST